MARKEESKPPKEKKPSWFRQVRQTYVMARKVDKWVGWLSLLAFVIGLVLFGLLAFFVGPLWIWIPFGVTTSLLMAMIVFGRRAEGAAYRQVEGQPGAAMAAMSTLRRGFKATPAVAINRQQDVVHRVVGKVGIVLVAEGNPQRLSVLLAQERRRCARIAADVPVHDLIVGNEEGQVKLRKLSGAIRKLPKKLTASQVSDLERRLKALPSHQLPIPKGPMPRNARLPKGGMPPTGR